ncbi:MAG: hypothetical protein U0359_19245 [Byssovorax sp.]
MLAILAASVVSCASAIEVPGGTGGPSDAQAPVQCEAATCGPGQICLWPSEYCDYDTMPPEVVRDEKVCVDMPVECAVKSGDALVGCLDGALCKSVNTDDKTEFKMGLLDCGLGWLDCF